MTRKKTAPKKKAPAKKGAKKAPEPTKIFDIPYREGHEVTLPCGCEFAPPRLDCGRQLTMCETHQYAFKTREVCQDIADLGQGEWGGYDNYCNFEDIEYNEVWRKAVALLQKVKSEGPRHGEIPKGGKDKAEYLGQDGIYDIWILETEAGDMHLLLKFGQLPYECVGTSFGVNGHSFSGPSEQKVVFDRAFAIYQMGVFGGYSTQ